MSKVVSLWRGKPIDSYTKKELIEIVIELGQSLQQESYEHSRQLDVLSGLIPSDSKPAKTRRVSPQGPPKEGE